MTLVGVRSFRGEVVDLGGEDEVELGEEDGLELGGEIDGLAGGSV